MKTSLDSLARQRNTLNRGVFATLIGYYSKNVGQNTRRTGLPSPAPESIINIRMAIRILLANHQPIIRSGLRFLLEREVDFNIVGEAADGKETMILAECTPAIGVLIP